MARTDNSKFITLRVVFSCLQQFLTKIIPSIKFHEEIRELRLRQRLCKAHIGFKSERLSFLFMTCRLDKVNIPVNFQEKISYGWRATVLTPFLPRARNSETERTVFLVHDLLSLKKTLLWSFMKNFIWFRGYRLDKYF